ncbi:hypothetical protein C0J52_04529 [Blattella germanica]|nr:hypothetical protein C0J52_04529 [Blattella germanica]
MHMESSACVIKPVVKSQDEGNESAPVSDVKREPSPELARISALITRPPKQKSSSKTAQPKQENISEPVAPPTISIPTPTVPRVGSTSSPTPTSGSSPILPKSKKGLAKRVQKIKGKEITKKMGMTSETEPTKEPVPFYYSEKREGCPNESTPSPLAFGPKPAPVLPSTCVGSKNSIAAKSKQRPGGQKAKHGGTTADDKGNKIWICPECEGQDDGSPMIGCDGCDAWYHWVCVGIQVPPDVNEDWYCRVCIVKKQQESIAFADKRKKSRKKKVVA